VRTPGAEDTRQPWPPPGWGSRVVWALTAILLLVCGVIAFRVFSIPTLGPSTKTLLVIFTLLPLPLCFVLVRAYTRMLEDERVKALSEAWVRCDNGYVGTPQYREAEAESESRPEAALRIFYDHMQRYVLERHPEMADFYLALRKIALHEGASADDEDISPAEWVAAAARSLAAIELRMSGLNRRAYTLPVFLFAFAYLAGLTLMLPAIEMFEAEVIPHWANLTLNFGTTTVPLPLMVLQAGYLGGAAYAAFTIISRVLNRDITPRLFLVASVRLMLAPLGALVLYLSTPDTLPIANVGMATSTGLLLLYFVAGGFPFALLAEGAEALFSRLEVGKRRLLAGKRSTTLIEGIGVFTAQRVSEEGIEVIQHLAFCEVGDLARRTRYAERTVADWKDQAILYLLTGDCAVPGRTQPDEATPTLYDLLDVLAGIRCASALLRRVCLSEPATGTDRRDVLRVRPDIEAFFWQLGLLHAEEQEGKREVERLTFLFARFCEDAMVIDPGLRQAFADAPATRT
jgi:hypothetical protein